MCSCDGVSLVWMSSPVTPSIAAAATDRACTSSPTLVRSVNTGASHNCRQGRARGFLSGNPRISVSEAPARNPSRTATGQYIPSRLVRTQELTKKLLVKFLPSRAPLQGRVSRIRKSWPDY
ncbi:hypothetical protein ACFFX0_16520 [Citricoccus parietis]|uniref:Uncharacterized protein n=1 Tax=Citricoccus parietis TaxID=592307 RepID=A0ABV5G1A1_9MICC